MILLDTHALVWLRVEPAKLSPTAREAIRVARQGGGVAISATTLWELAWLATLGRLHVHGTVDAFVEQNRVNDCNSIDYYLNRRPC